MDDNEYAEMLTQIMLACGCHHACMFDNECLSSRQHHAICISTMVPKKRIIDK